MLMQDVRYAARTLFHNKAFTVVAVLCLAIGIGVNATIFSVVDGVLLQPFPYDEPDGIVTLYETHQRGGISQSFIGYPTLRDWREQSRAFTTIAGLQGRSLAISDGGEPERYVGAAISWDLFSMLGVRPALGRGFTADDDRPGAEPVVLLSDDVWQRRYAGDPSVVGRTVRVSAQPHTIIGVMPPRFNFPSIHRLWVPLAPLAHQNSRTDRGTWPFARLRPGVSLEQARGDIAATAKRLATQYQDAYDGWSAIARPLREDFIPDDVELVIWTMMGAVTLVLLIAGANVANLLLARALARQREMAVRAALGAGRLRIVRQLVVESALVGLLAAPLGVGIAWVGLGLLDRAMPPDEVPYYIQWHLDARTLLYTIVVAALTGAVFGLAPAVQLARANLHDSLKEGGRGSSVGGRRARLRNALVVAEVALALVLLVGASLFVRSFFNLDRASAGFDTRPLMTMRVFMTGEPYATDEAKAQRVEDIVRRVETLPGVEAAFASNLVPLGGGGGGGRAIVDGQPVPAGEEPNIGFTAVTPHFFRTLNVPVRGRDVTDLDGASRTPVAVINQTMAKRLWPTEDPIGRRFRLKGDDPPDWFTVIGVAPDIEQGEIDDDPPLPVAYVPYPYMPTPNTGLTIRVKGDPAQITAAVRREIRLSDPNIALFSIRTMEELRRLGFWQYRLFGWMFSIFGGIALCLAAIGVYGVLSYAVSQRTQEIGVRVALGAGRGDVLRLVVGHGLRLALAGIAVGLAGAFGVTRVVRSLLYNVTPTDPVSFAGVALFLTGVAALASYVPARRATTVDPIVALRQE